MKIFLFTLCVLLALILLLLFSPTKIHFYVFKEDIRLSAQILFFRIKLYPRKERKPKKQKKVKDAKATEGQAPPKRAAEPTANKKSVASEQIKTKTHGKKTFPKLSLDLIREYFDFAIEALGKLGRLILIEKLKIHADIVCDDPAKTAMAYGSAAAAVNILLPEIEQKIRIRKTDILVTSAFDKTETEIEFEMTASIIVICAIVAGLKLFLKFSKINKGGAL